MLFYSFVKTGQTEYQNTLTHSLLQQMFLGPVFSDSSRGTQTLMARPFSWKTALVLITLTKFEDNLTFIQQLCSHSCFIYEAHFTQRSIQGW